MDAGQLQCGEDPWQEVWSTHASCRSRDGWPVLGLCSCGCVFPPLIPCLLECLMIVLRLSLPHVSFIVSQTMSAGALFFVLGLCSSFPKVEHPRTCSKETEKVGADSFVSILRFLPLPKASVSIRESQWGPGGPRTSSMAVGRSCQSIHRPRHQEGRTELQCGPASWRFPAVWFLWRHPAWNQAELGFPPRSRLSRLRLN